MAPVDKKNEAMEAFEELLYVMEVDPKLHGRSAWAKKIKLIRAALTPSPMDEDVQNLAMLVKRLCHAIRNSTNDDSPAREVVGDALGYLSRKGLSGTPLRKEYTAQSVSPYKDYTWEDVAMLVQENRALKEAATAQKCELNNSIKESK